jgi:hypothetical protein
MARSADTGRGPGRPGRGQPPAPQAPDSARDDEDGLDAWVKAVVDTLPPLTEDQRDLLALIFRQHRR